MFASYNKSIKQRFQLRIRFHSIIMHIIIALRITDVLPVYTAAYLLFIVSRSTFTFRFYNQPFHVANTLPRRCVWIFLIFRIEYVSKFHVRKRSKN